MARKKNKNLCCKCLIKHRQPMAVEEHGSDKMLDNSGQEAAPGSSINNKSPPKKNLTLKSIKASLPVPTFSGMNNTDVKITSKSAKDFDTSPFKKKQIQKAKSSVQSLFTSVVVSSTDDSSSEVTYT